MKKSKYNARKTKCHYCKELHDSAKEAARCDELHRMQNDGLIRDLQTQVKILLVPATKYSHVDCRMCNERAMAYIADFKYTECSSGCVIIEDVKGVKTDVYKDKRKIVKYMFCRNGECVFLET